MGAAALLLVAGPALAKPQRTPLGFGIEAVGFKSYFVFRTHAGRTIRGAVRLRSTSERDRTVFLRAADAHTADTGGLDYGRPGARAVRTGTWIRLQRRRVRLPASGSVEVPFTARVPRGAGTGDHLAGILAYGRTPRRVPTRGSKFRLRFISRLAIALQFRVMGRLTSSVELRGAGIQVAPAGAVLGLKLASTGNALIPTTTGTVTVSQHGRDLFSRPVRVDALVPGTAITYPVAWQGKPVEGAYRVKGNLYPRGGAPVRIDQGFEFAKKRIREFKRETGRPAVESRGTSPALVALLVVLFGALAAVGAAYLRLRRAPR